MSQPVKYSADINNLDDGWVQVTISGDDAHKLTEQNITAALSALHAKAGVGVEGLEWQDDTPTGLFADTEFGSYGINDAWLERGNEKFEVNLEVKLIGCYPTLEAAKAAAQADYAARIRSTLSTKLQEPVGWRWRSGFCGEKIQDDWAWMISSVKPERQGNATDFQCEPLYASPTLAHQPVTAGWEKDGAHLTLLEVEKLFPDWKSYRDLIDCIECTLHALKSGDGK